MEGIEAYPLHWPHGWKRRNRRERAKFSTSFANARDGLIDELRLMGAKNIVLSTNIELRRDGLPYAKAKQPEDPGIAIYFQHKNRSMSFASDRWSRVEDNVQAIRKTIEALRGIERWSASDMMERAFTGFEALPDQTQGAWWAVLCVKEHASASEVKQAYKKLRSKFHPDKPDGDQVQFNTVQNAYNEWKER